MTGVQPTYCAVLVCTRRADPQLAFGFLFRFDAVREKMMPHVLMNPLRRMPRSGVPKADYAVHAFRLEEKDKLLHGGWRHRAGPPNGKERVDGYECTGGGV